MSVKIKGLQKVINGLERIEKRVEKNLKKQLQNVTLDLSIKSLERTPMHDGELRKSIQVDSDGLTSSISYNTDYALEIHEDLDIIHPIHTWNGETYNCHGTAKYLENPLKENEAKYRKNIEDTVRRSV